MQPHNHKRVKKDGRSGDDAADPAARLQQRRHHERDAAAHRGEEAPLAALAPRRPLVRQLPGQGHLLAELRRHGALAAQGRGDALHGRVGLPLHPRDAILVDRVGQREPVEPAAADDAGRGDGGGEL